jgi:D-alanyl-D-alanine endopeptidase (penicillin-binding protein 7)
MKSVEQLALIGTGVAFAAVLAFFLSWLVATAQPEAADVPRASVTASPVAAGNTPVTAAPAPRAIEAPVAARMPLPQPAVPATVLLRQADANKLFLRSSGALVVDESEDVILYGRNVDEQRPIASLTKLMTAIAIIDTGLPLDEQIEITRADRDRLKGSKSRLRYGTILSRYDMLYVALAASDNRAAAALARTYPGGPDALIAAMDAKARDLGMMHTHFADAAGLRAENVSTVRDLVKLARTIRQYPLIDAWSVTRRFRVTDHSTGKEITFRNTNRLVHRDSWRISLSKTGYTAEAGNCLLMRAVIADRPVIIVLLNSWGKLSKYGDSHRIRQWLLDIEHKIEVLIAASAST